MNLMMENWMQTGRTLLILLLLFSPLGLACSDDSDTSENIEADAGDQSDAGEKSDAGDQSDAGEDAHSSPDGVSDDVGDDPTPSFALSKSETSFTESTTHMVWVGSKLYTAYSERCTTKCIEGWDTSGGSASSIDDARMTSLDEYSMGGLYVLDENTLLYGTNYYTHRVDISSGVDLGESSGRSGERQDYVGLSDGRIVGAETNHGLALFGPDLSVDASLNLQDDIRSVTNFGTNKVLAGGFRSGTLYEVSVAGNQLIANDSWSVEGDYVWRLDSLDDGTILLAAGTGGLGVFDSEVNNLAYLSDGNEVYDIEVIDQNHVLTAGQAGVQLVDLSDRSNPKVIDEIPMSEGAWRVAANQDGDLAISDDSGDGVTYLGRYR